MTLRALARVNLAAIERNVGATDDASWRAAQSCARSSRPTATVMAAAPAARAALAGGATVLAVATADEAGELRAARRRGADCS